MQEQPEKNIRLIIELLHTMSPNERVTAQIPANKRTGLAKEIVSLPDDFDQTFDALDKDVSALFYGDTI